MKFRWLCRVAVAISLASLFAPVHAPAADSSATPPAVQSLRIGFNNIYKLGSWTPVEVRFADKPSNYTAPGELAFEAPDGDAAPALYVSPGPPVSGESRIIYAKIGRGDGPISLQFLPIDAKSATARGEPLLLKTLSADDLPRALPGTDELIVELGGTIGLGELFRRGDQNELAHTTVVTIDHSPQPLPDRWYGYEGVDLLVIVGAATIEKSLFDEAAIDALDAWVRRGGTLLVECGEDANKVVGPGAPLARFAPGDNLETIDRQPFGAIESFAEASEPIDVAAARRSIKVPQWKNVKGRVELSERSKTTEIPLVVHWPVGFGQVIFVGLDLDRPPFSAWPERGKFLEKLLRLRTPSVRTSVGGAATPGRHLGYIDLSGQLRSALDQFEGVHLVPFWTVTLLTMAYIAILFPLNYFVAFRWLKRPQLAWIVFPVAAVLFCATAYAMAYQAKGSRLRVNQIDLIDVDVTANWARGSTWFNLFSPANAAYDLRVKPKVRGANGEATRAEESILSWFGLAGGGLGAMSSTAASLPLVDQPYTIDPAYGVAEYVPLAKWSSKSFVARWTAPAGGIEHALTATLDRRLQGTVTNRLPKPLKQCVLFYGRWAYPLESISPGQSVRLERKEPSTVETFLTHRHLFATRNEVPPYDRADFDLARILEVMMFHNAAGGVNYTGLLNRQQAFVDLSTQLDFGQAILVGSGEPCVDLQINGETPADENVSRHETIYRFVLPVTVKQ